MQDHVAPGRLWAEVRASPGEAPRAAAHGDMHQDIRLRPKSPESSHMTLFETKGGKCKAFKSEGI